MSLYVPEIKSEKPERRSGHVCVHFQDKLFVWGGYNDEDESDRNQYMIGNFLWIYDINTCQWRHVECNGEIPPGRSGACAACIGQIMYIFGGHCDISGHCNDLYSLDQVTYHWKNLSMLVQGEPPIPRDKFGCWVYKNRVIYFGGYGPHIHNYTGSFVIHEGVRGWNADLVVLQLNYNNSLEWTYPSTEGSPPQPRAAHGMARIGSTGYLFGGRHSECRDNDLHCFNLETYEWSGRLSVTGAQPCGRSWHVFIPCGSKHILLHGGFDANSKELEDAWLLDVHSLTWIQMNAFNQLSSPRTRLWHTACKTSNEGEVAIFGGCSRSFFGPTADHTNDLMLFHVSPRKLQRLCEEVVIKSKTCCKVLPMLPKAISRILSSRLGILE